ncbi:hypothetical protein [Blastococcus brunescens]|uniref:DUF998 domain-containing protein n=1 Tax=Blastococcus brunescens TaxID=1564165 RepID=A0ABZ1B286_9ACTN|nr:hypothetical protein [Blastococcus sp. BMG 8361]WRL64859.1 hypothetical protein U6N30_03705 [Blastococcus sp. BMG 8361]
MTARATLMLAIALSVVDVLLIIGNLVHLRVNGPREPVHQVFSSSVWNGYLDNSFPEMFGFAQLVGAVVALGFVWSDRRAGVYLAWMVVLLVVLADDLLQLHERGGATLVGSLDLPAIAGLRAQDLGELAVWASFAVALAPALLVTHVRASPVDRRNSWIVSGGIAVLAVAGVVVDLLDIALVPLVPAVVSTGVTVLETTGELVATTVLAVSAFAMAMRSAVPARPPAA